MAKRDDDGELRQMVASLTRLTSLGTSVAGWVLGLLALAAVIVAIILA